MRTLDELVRAVLAATKGDLPAAVEARALWRQLETMAETELLGHPPPVDASATAQALGAGLLELCLARRGLGPPPTWAARVRALEAPLFLVRATRGRRERLRRTAPDALRKRNIYAPANYLRSA